MAIEFARNVLKIEDAQHAEHDPYASKLVVNPLTCDLKGSPLEIQIINQDSITYGVYNSIHALEKYYCNFGLNPEYEYVFNQNGFLVVGSDIHKEARILELRNHPFFIATLFVPQDNSSYEKPHPLITKFIEAAIEYEKSATNSLG